MNFTANKFFLLSLSILLNSSSSFQESPKFPNRSKSILIQPARNSLTRLFSVSGKDADPQIKETSVEELQELTKESFFCLRTPEPNPTSTCTVECKRKDGKPLGYDASKSSNLIEDYVRRAFVFVKEPTPHGISHGPISIHVREIPFSYGKLGGQIWYAAVAFGQYVALHASLFKGKKILELGAGLGLPGLVASKCGGHVTLSEFGYNGEVDGEVIEMAGEKRLIPSALLDNLRYNVLLNKDSNGNDETPVKVRHLDWYDYVDYDEKQIDEEESYDLIIGSDLINWEDDIGPLISTLQYFLSMKEGSKAIISLSAENRRGLPKFLENIRKEFKTVDIKEQSVIHFEEHPLILITLTM